MDRLEKLTVGFMLSLLLLLLLLLQVLLVVLCFDDTFFSEDFRNNLRVEDDDEGVDDIAGNVTCESETGMELARFCG